MGRAAALANELGHVRSAPPDILPPAVTSFPGLIPPPAQQLNLNLVPIRPQAPAILKPEMEVSTYMSTEAQINANRQNAQYSTGAITPEGRRKVRMNSLKHGFAGQTVVLPPHEYVPFRDHFESFRQEYRPKGPTEEFLVQSLASLSWSAEQIRAQAITITTLAGTDINPVHTNTTPERDAAIGQVRSIDRLAPMMDLLSKYEARKMRSFTNTHKQLVQTQATRKAQEKAELTEAALYRKACKLHRAPDELEWHPSENGFVCSLEQIDRHIYLQDRLTRPKQAAA